MVAKSRILWLPLPFFPLSTRRSLLKAEGEYLKPTKAESSISLLRVQGAELVPGFIWDCLTAMWAGLNPSNCQAFLSLSLSLSLISAL
jgi:hypothetical protein